MGSHSRKSRHRKPSPESSGSTASSDLEGSSSPTSEDQIESSSGRRRRERERKRSRGDGERSKRKHSRKDRERRDKRKENREKRKRRYDSSEESDSELENPEDVVKFILKEFPGVSGDLETLLRMIDDGQAVDIGGLSEKSLVKQLRRLFVSLDLKEKGDQVFLLPRKASPTLNIVGPILASHLHPQKDIDPFDSATDEKPVPPDMECRDVADEKKEEDPICTKRRAIGPELPSAELLAAAAKLTEAQAEMREAEMDDDTALFIGPPPPAVVAEAGSANEAERFEEVTRIIGAEENSPYDVLGINKDMAPEKMKKRYWKLSLMIHPDKCAHPQAHQAFVKLNKGFKDLQDPDKRKAIDDKIKQKEEQEAFQVELKAMREAAQWRRIQGIAMEGDDLLLADMDAKAARTRDEWMTSLPPERKPGVSMHSTTSFSMRSKEGRGDTSAWTDTPSERAQKAKMNYLEAYNEAAAIASKEQEKTRSSADAELVDQYNKAKRSKSLVEKHLETSKGKKKMKSKQQQQGPSSESKDEWEGKHPWKPWDREKDLTAGRQSVKLDPENMSQGLTSRFASGSFQRNFL